MPTKVVHEHSLAIQLTLVIVEFPYWRKVGRDSLNSENESRALTYIASFTVIDLIICVIEGYLKAIL
jgi:hypothetical protein